MEQAGVSKDWLALYTYSIRIGGVHDRAGNGEAKSASKITNKTA